VCATWPAWKGNIAVEHHAHDASMHEACVAFDAFGTVEPGLDASTVGRRRECQAQAMGIRAPADDAVRVQPRAVDSRPIRGPRSHNTTPGAVIAIRRTPSIWRNDAPWPSVRAAARRLHPTGEHVHAAANRTGDGASSARSDGERVNRHSDNRPSKVVGERST
jgi:hypothetical protein